jgi:hypothetical protein
MSWQQGVTWVVIARSGEIVIHERAWSLNGGCHTVPLAVKADPDHQGWHDSGSGTLDPRPIIHRDSWRRRSSNVEGVTVVNGLTMSPACRLLVVIDPKRRGATRSFVPASNVGAAGGGQDPGTDHSVTVAGGARWFKCGGQDVGPGEVLARVD